MQHVRPGLPPFLVISADNDLPTLPEMATDFAQALKAAKVPVQTMTVAGRNHNSIMFAAVQRDDPVAQAMLDFVREGRDAKGYRKATAKE
jgi:acetyl esterase/lipase